MCRVCEDKSEVLENLLLVLQEAHLRGIDSRRKAVVALKLSGNPLLAKELAKAHPEAGDSLAALHASLTGDLSYLQELQTTFQQTFPQTNSNQRSH